MREKTVRYLHKFASIFVSVALVSMFAFPLAVFADPADATVADETAATETAAEETAPVEEAAATDAEVVDTTTESTLAAVSGEVSTAPATGPTGFSALGGAWLPYTGGIADDITTFAINDGSIGHITAGMPGVAPSSPVLVDGSYYITAIDGTDLTYAYWHNDFTTSWLYIFVEYGGSLVHCEVGTLPVQNIWTQEVAPGYTAVAFESGWRTLVASDGSSLPFDFDFRVSLTMTPNPDGTVYHVWQVESGAGSDTVNLSSVYALDTMLNVVDDVSVYSLGTNQGFYLEDASAFAKVTLPWVATDGPDDMVATGWVGSAGVVSNIFGIFGSGLNVNINNGVPSNIGDLLFDSGDSAVYYRYGFQELTAGGVRNMTYAVGLGLNPAALPATGDSTSLMFVIAGLGVLAVGATLTTVAVRRRNRKHNSQ